MISPQDSSETTEVQIFYWLQFREHMLPWFREHMLPFVLSWKYFVALVFIVFFFKVFWWELLTFAFFFFKMSFSCCQASLLEWLYLHLYFIFEMSFSLKTHLKLGHDQHQMTPPGAYSLNWFPNSFCRHLLQPYCVPDTGRGMQEE